MSKLKRRKHFIWLFSLMMLIPLINLKAQEVDSKERNTNFVVSLNYAGSGNMYSSTSDLLLGYDSMEKGVAVISARLGLYNSSRKDEIGLSYTGFGRLSGFSLSAGNENKLSYSANSFGIYVKDYFTFADNSKINFYRIHGINYALLQREENIYNLSSSDWDLTKSNHHGLGIEIGYGIQCQVGKKSYFDLGYNLNWMYFFKKVNSYQEKDNLGMAFRSLSIGFRRVF